MGALWPEPSKSHWLAKATNFPSERLTKGSASALPEQADARGSPRSVRTVTGRRTKPREGSRYRESHEFWSVYSTSLETVWGWILKVLNWGGRAGFQTEL